MTHDWLLENYRLPMVVGKLQVTNGCWKTTGWKILPTILPSDGWAQESRQKGGSIYLTKVIVKKCYIGPSDRKAGDIY